MQDKSGKSTSLGRALLDDVAALDAVAALQAALNKHRHLAQTTRSKVVELKVRSDEAVFQSRELLTRVDALLKRP
jgi:hypothetical protein